MNIPASSVCKHYSSNSPISYPKPFSPFNLRIHFANNAIESIFKIEFRIEIPILFANCCSKIDCARSQSERNLSVPQKTHFDNIAVSNPSSSPKSIYLVPYFNSKCTFLSVIQYKCIEKNQFIISKKFLGA